MQLISKCSDFATEKETLMVLQYPPNVTHKAISRTTNGLRAGARGHGTHVAGTIAGAESGEKAGDNEADGLSFQGKLAIFDFGDSSNDNALSMPGQVR